jgi:NADH-quinone oxidoreductase subunit M
VLGIAGALGAVHGALLAWRATDLRTMIACLSLSHMGVVLVALSTRTELGLTAALLQMVAHGVVSPMLFVLVGIVERAFGSSSLTEVGALAATRPALAVAWAVGLAASLGLPGLASFPGEVHGWVAVVQAAPWLTPMLIAAMFLGAAASVRELDRLLWGPAPATGHGSPTATGPSMAAWWLGGWAVTLGWWPTAVLAPASATLAALGGALGGVR